MLWLILAIALGGLVIGALARLAVPGPDPMSWWMTILLGWGGSIVGGVVARILLGTTGGIIFALGGAILLLVLHRVFVQKRPLTGPGAHLPPG